MKILVTGFEPFGGESRNPSAEVVERLPDTIAGAEIVKLILPTVRFEAPQRVARAMEEHRPDVVLSIGQAGGRAAVSVERFAVNLTTTASRTTPETSRWTRRWSPAGRTGISPTCR